MARLQLCDGRKRLYQWDTGVEIEICECKTVTECHFVTPSGLVKGEVKNNFCKVPDVVLTHSGCLIVYAFARDGVYGTTRHDFRINVIARPKPADYIDATDESATIDAICDRLKALPECKGEKGDPGSGVFFVDVELTEPARVNKGFWEILEASRTRHVVMRAVLDFGINDSMVVHFPLSYADTVEGCVFWAVDHAEKINSRRMRFAGFRVTENNEVITYLLDE